MHTQDGGRNNIFDVSDGNYLNSLTIYVHNLIESDSGIYTCRVICGKEYRSENQVELIVKGERCKKKYHCFDPVSLRSSLFLFICCESMS